MKKIHIGMLKIFHFINFIVKCTTSEISGFEVFNKISGFEVFNILAYVWDLPQRIGKAI